MRPEIFAFEQGPNGARSKNKTAQIRSNCKTDYVRHCECEPSPMGPDQIVMRLDHKLSELAKTKKIE